MSTRFYSGQKDYIVQLNLMEDEFQSAVGTVTGKADRAGDTFTGPVTIPTLTVSGNLTVNGTTTTINSTTVTVDDPIITLGGDTNPTSDDNKDRGVEFRWHNGSVSKRGFFGFDDSTGKFTFIPDATNTSEVFSGTAGTVVANLEGNVTGNLTGTVTASATAAGAVAQLARFINTSGTANSAAAISLDPGNNGWNSRDVQLRGVNNGSNQTSLEVYTSNAAAPTLAFKVDHQGNATATGTVTGTNLVYTTGTQTIGGGKTFSSQLSFAGGWSSNHPTDVNGAVTVNWHTDDYWRHRFGGTNTPKGISLSDYDTTNITLNRNGNIMAKGMFTRGTDTAYLAPRYDGSVVTPAIQSHGVNGADAAIGVFNWATSAISPAALIFAKSKSGVIGTRGAVALSDDIGDIAFTGDDGTNFITGAAIRAEVDGTVAAGQVPARLLFMTSAADTNPPVERMRIDSSGQVGIGKTPETTLDIKAVDNVTTTYPLWIQNLSMNYATGYGAYGMSNRNLSGTATTIDYTFDIGGIALFNTAGVERMRIEADGRIQVGGNAATYKNAISINSPGHVNDGGNDYGLTIAAFEPAITLIDKSVGSGSGQVFYNGAMLEIRTDTLNDGTIGHTANTTTKIAAEFSADTTRIRSAGAEKFKVDSTGATVTGALAVTGEITAATPAFGDNDTSVATTAFVLANSMPYRGELTSATHLDTITATGVYVQSQNGDTTGNGYPDAQAGLLTVVGWSSFTHQTYHAYGASGAGGKYYTRAKYSTNAWTPWYQLAEVNRDNTFSANNTFTGTNSFYGGTDFTLQDTTDTTKKLQFALSSISTATTRTLTIPNLSGTIALTSNTQTFSGTTTFSAATNTFGSSTAAGTTGLATGATVSGSTKTVNIGTGGVSGSTTTMNFGPTAGAVTYTFNGTSAINLPVGTTAQRPAGTAGDIRLNSENAQFEGYNGTSWDALGANLTTLNTAAKNKIINGKMDIAQRGASFSQGTGQNGAYTLDRWWSNIGGAAVATVSQTADGPANTGFKNSLRVAVTTADASVAAGDYFAIGQKIEGYNVADLVGKTFTLSFWVRSSVTGTYCIRLGNEIAASANSRVYIAQYTVNAANTWEFKSITITGGIPSDGTWDFGSGVGLGLRFTLMAGSTFHGAGGSWLANVDTLATSSQVNAVATVGNIFALTGVQLEVGAIATPFEHRLFGQELALCQRYFEKSHDIWTAPGTNTGMTASIEDFTCADNAGSPCRVRFAVSKRGIPSLTVYDATGAAGVITISGGTNGQSVGALDNQGTSGFKIFRGSTTRVSFHWAANSEL